MAKAKKSTAKSTAPNYTVTKTGRNLFDVTYSLNGKPSQWEEWILLSGDRHWDNPKSDWEMQIKHLEEVKKRQAGIVDIGDLLCLMQGRFDRRSSKNDIRDIHQQGDYLDSIIETSTDFFKPYAENMIVVAAGNHEAAIKKHHETDMTQRFCDILKYKSQHKVHNGGHSGFVRFRLQEKGRTMGKILTLHYSHGYGGGGPVTKGIIQTNRKATYLPDADIVVSGHVHESWQIELMRVRVGRRKIYHDTQTHICVPTYKEEFKDGFGGWHVERGAPPKPLGALWMRLTFDKNGDDVKQGLKYELMRAT